MLDPQRRRNLTPTSRAAMVGVGALAILLMAAIAFMMGDNGTRNDANNRGPSGIPQNSASDNPPTAKVPSRDEAPKQQ
jgi:hypothetical protein